MGCSTKSSKIVGISLGSLQRLIALSAVPLSAVPKIVQTMGECMNQGVDIQLKILQTLLSLVTNFGRVHGELLGDVSRFVCLSLTGFSSSWFGYWAGEGLGLDLRACGVAMQSLLLLCVEV